MTQLRLSLLDPRLRRCGLLLVGLGLVAGVVTLTTAQSPLRNFRMPVFNDAGVRIFDLTAAAFQTLSEKPIRVEMTNVQVHMYDEEKPGTLDGQLFAAVANYDHETRIVSGPDQLHATYRDVELFGDDWTYDANAKSIVIRRNVIVTFPGELGHILR